MNQGHPFRFSTSRTSNLDMVDDPASGPFTRSFPCIYVYYLTQVSTYSHITEKPNFSILCERVAT